jgi:hypothetical protein
MTTGAPPPQPPDRAGRGVDPRIRLVAAIAAAALVIAVVVWLVVRDGDDDDDAPEPTVAVSVSAEDLVELSQEVDHPVYWAGPRENTVYELTRAPEGRIFIRYLPVGVRVGEPRPDFLTVGTYPMSDGFERLEAVASGQGTRRRNLPGGGLAISGGDRPTSAYFAYPDGKVQVEVHDPKPRRALKHITAGRIQPIR